MDSRVLPSFRKALTNFPSEIQELAAETYSIWKDNPRHPSLSIKRVSPNQSIYSVRVGSHYRALGRLRNGVIYWFGIGTHAAYDQLLKQL